jgi:hypothetical protein
LEPTSELLPQDITLNLDQYDAINFPVKFDGSTQKDILFNLPYKVCPPATPYMIASTQTCVTACPAGYTADPNKDCIVDLNLDFQSLDKLPDSNHIQMLFALVPNDPSLISSYPQVLWENVVNFNVPTSSKIFEYISTPFPMLKITI